MFVGRPPGNYDRLLDFSRAVTGNLFFVPSATFLDDVDDRRCRCRDARRNVRRPKPAPRPPLSRRLARHRLAERRNRHEQSAS